MKKFIVAAALAVVLGAATAFATSALAAGGVQCGGVVCPPGQGCEYSGSVANGTWLAQCKPVGTAPAGIAMPGGAPGASNATANAVINYLATRQNPDAAALQRMNLRDAAAFNALVRDVQRIMDARTRFLAGYRAGVIPNFGSIYGQLGFADAASAARWHNGYINYLLGQSVMANNAGDLIFQGALQAGLSNRTSGPADACPAGYCPTGPASGSRCLPCSGNSSRTFSGGGNKAAYMSGDCRDEKGRLLCSQSQCCERGQCVSRPVQEFGCGWVDK